MARKGGPAAGTNRISVAAHVDAILQASRASLIPPRNCIFVIGPFATRLNFFRQQNRALNLVWALNHKFGLAGKRVAVVGAGLAGLTSAAALLSLECKVTVYESKGSVMYRQRDTGHRFVHPNVNYWPDEALNPSTAFPFFNWIANECDSIADVIDREWATFSDLLHFAKLTTVSALAPAKTGIAVKTDDGSEDGTFNYVILTTGFQDERELKSITPRHYWNSTDFRVPEARDPPVFVSGAGDGGLIDAVRHSFPQFRKGRLALEIAGRLHSLADRQTAQEEARIAREALERRGKLIEAGTSFDPKSNPLDDDEAVLERAEHYLDLARQLPDGLRPRLRPLSSREPAVYLVSSLPAPFSSNAAPIHKLLLAYAMINKRIEHILGRIELVSDVAEIVPPPASGLRLDRDRTILRHGALFNIELLTQPEQSELLARQAGFIDKLDTPGWKRQPFPDPRLKGRTASISDFVKAHAPLAERIFEVQPGIQFVHDDGDQHFRYVVVDEKAMSEMPPPTQLFGHDFVRWDKPAPGVKALV